MRRLAFCFLRTRTGGTVWLTAALLMASAEVAKAQFMYTTNFPDTNTITIAGYTGSVAAVVIPSRINGLTVTKIQLYAFDSCASMTSVTIPDGVTNISIGGYAFEWCGNLNNATIGNGVVALGDWAFFECTSLKSVTIGNRVKSIGQNTFDSCNSLTNVMIGNAVTNIGYEAFKACWSLKCITIGNAVTTIGDYAFVDCYALANVTIPHSVTSIGQHAFEYCSSLSSVTIPNSVTNIGDRAFCLCSSLTALHFQGNAPKIGGTNLFQNSGNATVYYLPGTTNWGTTFGGRPTALWRPQISGDSSFSLQSDQFGFNINWASGMVAVVEACTNLTDSSWYPIQTNTLPADSSYFNDPNWTNNPRCFYRIIWQ